MATRTGTFYLNKAETRWIILTDGKKPQVTLIDGINTVTRTILWYEKIKDVEYMTISYNGLLLTIPTTVTDITNYTR